MKRCNLRQTRSMEASQCLRPLLAATPCDLSSTPPPSHSHLQHATLRVLFHLFYHSPTSINCTWWWSALGCVALALSDFSSSCHLPRIHSHSLCKIHNIWLLHKFLAVDGFSIPRNAGQIDNMGFNIGREMRLRKNRWVCMKCAANEFAISPRYLWPCWHS